MSDLRVSLLQQALHWENPAANRAQFETTLRQGAEIPCRI